MARVCFELGCPPTALLLPGILSKEDLLNQGGDFPFRSHLEIFLVQAT